MTKFVLCIYVFSDQNLSISMTQEQHHLLQYLKITKNPCNNFNIHNTNANLLIE